MDSLSQSKRDVVLEAKRIILQEQMERISDAALTSINLNNSLANKSNNEKCSKENCDKIAGQRLCKCNSLPKWDNEKFWTELPNPNNSNSTSNVGMPKTLQEFTDQIDMVQKIKLFCPTVKKHSKQVNNELRLDLKEDTKRNSVNTLLKKYFIKWKLHTKTIKAQEKILKETEERNMKLREFIKVLKEQKKRAKKTKVSNLVQNSNDTNNVIRVVENPKKMEESYKCRYMAQRNIIEKQKVEIEKQNKLIEDLKLNRINKDIETSVQQTHFDIKETLKHCSSKVKCKMVVLNSKEIKDDKEDDDETTLNPSLDIKFSAAPKIVMQMERRAKERAERRKIILERKRFIDEEKKRSAMEILQKQKQQEQEEKRKCLADIKERRRLEMEAEKRRQACRKAYMEKIKIAQNFYETKLKKNVMQTFRAIVWIKEVKMIEAKNLYETNLLIKHFSAWKNYVQGIVRRKKEKADQFYANMMKVKIFGAWKTVLNDIKISKQVADDFYDYYLIKNTFKTWNINVCIIYNEYVRKKKLADEHYKSRLLIHTFYLWKTLPSVAKLERLKEERKRKWREKVMEVLPDYNPIVDT